MKRTSYERSLKSNFERSERLNNFKKVKFEKEFEKSKSFSKSHEKIANKRLNKFIHDRSK
ncbi:hypothetical protein BN424_2176 [Carnobacterium maltaromaticum LMA28]|uniref:Uncharacterized protein n=1 Tax=Carnobacterium maltaromaticum LMA28 TaxID=1234679 RepID=K8ESP7_CARML|nr:hypothetical protein [Carnobacterium maltaromaticum]CCO11616.2 hypothetical protein BN424_2176 [Carnobacterium maltaromaticum LMA28]